MGALLLALGAVIVGCIAFVWRRRGLLTRALLHPATSRSRRSIFAAHPIRPGDIVMLGDSITQRGEWAELFPGTPIRNRGINGDRSDDVAARLDEILTRHPRKLFLCIGTNDIGTGIRPEHTLAHIEHILDRSSVESPQTQVVVQGLFPRNAAFAPRVRSLNARLRRMCEARGLLFIDLFESFAAADGSILPNLTVDDLHLSGEGYQLWRDILAPCVAE